MIEITYANELDLNSFIFSTKENENFVTPGMCERVLSWADIEK